MRFPLPKFAMVAVRVLLFLWTVSAFAQSDRGTITGTINDPAGAVVPSAPIQARNVETSSVYEAATSSTGNYTTPQLPPRHLRDFGYRAGIQEVRPPGTSSPSGANHSRGYHARSRLVVGVCYGHGSRSPAQDGEWRAEPQRDVPNPGRPAASGHRRRTGGREGFGAFAIPTRSCKSSREPITLPIPK